MDRDPIISGARTVAHMAVYLDELRARGIALRDGLGVGDAGYFTPTAEQEVRAVYFSYLQARSALYELVLQVKPRATQLPEAFLVGYAGACLLIDAARFMVRTFAGDPIVRRKLNEADPLLGIEANTFDAIGRSLTRSRHAWHLYHARRFFRQNVKAMRKAAEDPNFRPAYEVIKRRRRSLDVTFGTFLRATLQLRYNRVTRRVNDVAVGRMLYGLQELFSRLAADLSTVPTHRPQLPDAIAAELLKVLKRGDVLVMRKEHVLTNYFLPGYWPHVALYLGDGRVLEAMKDGVWERSIDSPFGSDAMAVIRPRVDEATIEAAIARGLTHEGKAYDFDFDFTRSDRMVCTEVVYRSYEGLSGMAFKLTPRVGRMTLSAVDLMTMAMRGEGFDPVAVYVPGGIIQTGEAARPTLESTMSQAT